MMSSIACSSELRGVNCTGQPIGKLDNKLLVVAQWVVHVVQYSVRNLVPESVTHLLGVKRIAKPIAQSDGDDPLVVVHIAKTP